MTLTIYENKSDKIRLDKDITQIATYDGYLREGCSVTDPIIKVEGIFNIFQKGNANYMFLPDYRRYYYITDIIQLRANIVEIHAKVDVLMSFRNEIRACSGIISKSSNNYNLYLDDGSLKAYQNKELDCADFPNGFSTERYILTLAG